MFWNGLAGNGGRLAAVVFEIKPGEDSDSPALAKLSGGEVSPVVMGGCGWGRKSISPSTLTVTATKQHPKIHKFRFTVPSLSRLKGRIQESTTGVNR